MNTQKVVAIDFYSDKDEEVFLKDVVLTLEIEMADSDYCGDKRKLRGELSRAKKELKEWLENHEELVPNHQLKRWREENEQISNSD